MGSFCVSESLYVVAGNHQDPVTVSEYCLESYSEQPGSGSGTLLVSDHTAIIHEGKHINIQMKAPVFLGVAPP